MLSKRTVTIGAMAIILAFGLAGCGTSSSPSNAANDAGSSPSSSTASNTGNGGNVSDGGNANEPSKEELAKAEYERACALFDEGKFYSAKVAFEQSAYGDWEQRAATCVQPMPETGELFHDEAFTSDNMMLNFHVKEENADKGYYITVSTKDGQLVETVFVRGTGDVETWIPSGEYYVKDSTGLTWYGTDEQFGPDGSYETMIFDKVEGDRYLTSLEEAYIWDITINNTEEVGDSVKSEESSWENRG